MKLIHGDCLEEMKHIESGSVNLIVTSPPYFNAKDYSNWETYEGYLDWCNKWIQGCLRVLENGRMICVNVSSVITARKSRNTRSTRHNIPGDIHCILNQNGAWFAEDLIWEKPEGAATNRNQRFSLDRHPMQWRANPTTEHILVYQKPTSVLNDKIIRAKSNGHRVEGDFDRGEVWKMNPSKIKGHPASYPESLPYKLTRYYSWPSECVLDPFAGSGTTGVACKRLNRDFIGIEKDADYFDIACKRINAES